MPGMPISDADVEALLTRGEPSDAELTGLASALARVDMQRLAVGVEGRVGLFSIRAAALARQSVATPTHSLTWWRRVGPKLATSALSVVAVIGMAGVAVASDSASPGDLLYGIDQALERIGINDGGTAERLDEAVTLADRGLTAQAVSHAADALTSVSPESADALQKVIENLGDNAPVKEDLIAMLQWMATTEVTGRDFGQGVAERARLIGVETDEAAGDQNPVGGDNQAGNRDNDDAPPGAGDSDGAPGKSDDAGDDGNPADDNPGNDNPGNGGGGNDNPGNGGPGKGNPGNGGGPPGGNPPGRAGNR